MMKVHVEEISATERRLDIEVPAEQVAGQFDRVFRQVGQSARLPGFRAGRIPRRVLERYFADDVRQQVTARLVGESLSSALEESKLEPVTQPELEIGALQESEALRFSARVEIRPSLGEVDTAGLVAERPALRVDQSDIDRVLEELRQSGAELVPIEGRSGLERGDFAGVKVAVHDGSEAIEALSLDSAMVEVAGGSLPPPVDERLALARVGETFEVEAAAPQGAPAALAEKSLRYVVTVLSVAERRVPELDDEFARDHGECETLAELRARIASRLEREMQRRIEARMRESILEQLLKRQPIDLPPSLVTRRSQELLSEFKLELAAQGLRLSSLEHEEEARGKLKPRAERDVAADLLLDQVAAQLGVEVSEDEVAEQIGKIVSSAGQSRERLRTHYADPGARDALRTRMRRAQTLERLVAAADVKDVETHHE